MATFVLVALTTSTISARWLDQRGDATSGDVIWGYIYDPLGEPAAGTTITLDNNVIEQDKGPFGPPVVLETTSDVFGFYRFENVPSGAYVLSPEVDWARAVTVYAPPSGSVQHDVWIAFDTVATALFISLDVLGPAKALGAPTPREGPVEGPGHIRRSNLPTPKGFPSPETSSSKVTSGLMVSRRGCASSGPPSWRGRRWRWCRRNDGCQRASAVCQSRCRCA